MGLFHMLLLVSLIMIQVGNIDSKCFSAIFNFGDSISDTGEDHAAFPDHLPVPYGSTFFKKPAGRASDGRLIIDFLAEALGLHFLTPYLKPEGSFKNGVNFAAVGAAALPPNSSFPTLFPLSVFNLGVQLQQMREFKSIVEEVHKHGSKNRFPSPKVFGKSLYMLYIGQADIVSQVETLGADGVKQFFPRMVSSISHTIRELYGLGGRTFWVFGVGPAGCDPIIRVIVNQASSYLDSAGCYFPLNDAVSEYNKLLRESLWEIRGDNPEASIIYVDTFSVKLDLFKNPTHYGLKYGAKVCCGHGGGLYNFDLHAPCGCPNATACKDPWNYVSWDGSHLTEAANRVIAREILNGSLFEPPFPLKKLCLIHGST
ncbi:GDSL esterase/lipase [Rosa sericea]